MKPIQSKLSSGVARGAWVPTKKGKRNKRKKKREKKTKERKIEKEKKESEKVRSQNRGLQAGSN